MVSHSLAAAVKVLMREFDILVAQLEHLLSTNRLSLQKMVRIILVLFGFNHYFFYDSAINFCAAAFCSTLFIIIIVIFLLAYI